MKSKAHTKHHYIPQCYLRGFAHNNGRTVYAYDKCCSGIKDMSIKSVCTIDNLYEISNRYADNFIDGSKMNQLMLEKEHFADHIEPTYSAIIKQVTAIKDECLNTPSTNIGLCYEDKFLIAKLIVIQFLRLPEVMKAIMSVYNSIEQDTYKSIQGIISRDFNIPEVEKINMELDEGGAFVYAKIALCNDEFIDPIAGRMAQNYWTFNISESGGFYTSEFPIIVEPLVKDAILQDFGLTQYGGVVTFPLTKDILIAIFDREYFADKKHIDGRFFVTSTCTEDYYNRLTYLYAKRFVFAYNNDFTLIDKLTQQQKGTHTFIKPNLQGVVPQRMIMDNKNKTI